MLVVCGQVSPLFAQANFADTIWAGTLTASTKVVAHYQNGVKRNTVTGATANGIPMELWFPTATTFSVVFNNSTSSQHR